VDQHRLRRGRKKSLETGVSKLSSMWPRECGGGADDTSADTSSGITSLEQI